MLQSVAYVARIRNGYSGRNGAGQAVTGQDDVDRIRAFGVADGAALQASQARAAAAPRGPCRSRSRGVGAVLVGLFGISPGVMLESCQARRDEGEIKTGFNHGTLLWLKPWRREPEMENPAGWAGLGVTGAGSAVAGDPQFPASTNAAAFWRRCCWLRM